eukprot:5944909-Prymnesium_polylepis.1
MPISLADLEAVRADAFADDVEIDLGMMAGWSLDDARQYFESGGTTLPSVPQAPKHVLMLRAHPASFSSHPWAAQPIADGQIELRIARWVLTANTLTYAFMGDMAQFWTLRHFPVPEGVIVDGSAAKFARSPTWGVGVVSASRCDGIRVGATVFGYVPMSPTVVLEPTHIQPSGGFRDAAPARKAMLPTYMLYGPTPTAHDAPDRPLPLDEEAFSMAEQWSTGYAMAGSVGPPVAAAHPAVVLITSASSRTARAAAFCLTHRAQRSSLVVGVTSGGHHDYVSGLGLFDTVLTYDALATNPLGEGTVAVLDVAGKPAVKAALYRTFGRRIASFSTIGNSHFDFGDASASDYHGGAAPVFLNTFLVHSALFKHHGKANHERLQQELWA